MRTVPRVDPAWWRSGVVDGRPMVEVLRARDVAAVFRFLNARGWSRAAIAAATGLSESRVRVIIQGRQQITSYEVLERIASGLEIPRDRLGLGYGDATAQDAEGTKRQIPDEASGRRPVADDLWPDTGLEPLDVVIERLLRLSGGHVDAAVLDVISLAIDDIVARYEIQGPRRLARETTGVRALLDQLLDRHSPPDLRQRLLILAGQVSGLLAYMSGNQGRFGYTAAYCHEAIMLANSAGDRGLVAWIRGTQSYAAYYRGDFRSAVDFARAGLQVAGTGPQAIRLKINGEARALARMPGCRKDAEKAVAQALRLVDRHRLPDGMSACISFSPYSPARVLANAVTVHLSLGDVDRVEEYAGQIDGVIDMSDSTWSRALVRLDVATALLHGRDPEVEQAMRFGIDALLVSADNPIRSIWQRARDLARTARPFAQHASVREFDDRLQQWRARPAVTLIASADR